MYTKKLVQDLSTFKIKSKEKQIMKKYININFMEPNTFGVFQQMGPPFLKEANYNISICMKINITKSNTVSYKYLQD